MLAVIGVYTGFGSHLKRNRFRGSWMPRDDALKKLEETGVVIRFVIGRSANRGDCLDRKIDEENFATKDFLILENHEEAQEELPKKVKFYYSAAVQNWDAEFYVKVDDNVDLDLEGLIGLLESRRGQDGGVHEVWSCGYSRVWEVNGTSLSGGNLETSNRTFVMQLVRL